MARLQRKSTASPEQVRHFPHGHVEVTSLDEFVVSRIFSEPGWRWSVDVKPIAQTPSCQLRHLGVALGGRIRVRADDGTEAVISAGDAYEIPPGHDAWVEGDEAWDTYEFTSGRVFAVAPEEEDRRVATLLFTDIVDSTGELQRLGDRRWREVLLAHNERIRAALDRFRGEEITTTGDGFFAVFDSARRAIRCAIAIRMAVADLGIQVRQGIHTGEVEFVGGNVRGLAVHLAARIMAVAGPGEVVVGATTMQLAGSAELPFASIGVHVLKGIDGSYELFRLAE